MTVSKKILTMLICIICIFSCNTSNTKKEIAIPTKATYLTSVDIAILKNCLIETRTAHFYYIEYYYDFPKSNHFFSLTIQDENSKFKIKNLDFFGSNKIDSIYITSHWDDYETMLCKKVEQFIKLNLSSIYFQKETKNISIETRKSEHYIMTSSLKKAFADKEFYKQYIRVDSNLYVAKDQWNSR
jgi:hypothetical protein